MQHTDRDDTQVQWVDDIQSKRCSPAQVYAMHKHCVNRVSASAQPACFALRLQQRQDVAWQGT